MPNDPTSGQAQNTDRELWREREGDYYADSIHVTQGGGIGMNCGGTVIVMPIHKWHALAAHKPSEPTGEWTCDSCRTYFDECEKIHVNEHYLQAAVSHLLTHLGHQARPVEPAAYDAVKILDPKGFEPAAQSPEDWDRFDPALAAPKPVTSPAEESPALAELTWMVHEGVPLNAVTLTKLEDLILAREKAHQSALNDIDRFQKQCYEAEEKVEQLQRERKDIQETAQVQAQRASDYAEQLVTLQRELSCAEANWKIESEQHNEWRELAHTYLGEREIARRERDAARQALRGLIEFMKAWCYANESSKLPEFKTKPLKEACDKAEKEGLGGGDGTNGI